MSAASIPESHPSFRPLGRLPLFKPGKTAYLNGREMVVSYVHIMRGQLLVHLQGHANAVPADHLDMAPTELLWPTDRLDAHKYRLPPPKAPLTPTDDDPAASSIDDIFAQATA